MCPRSTLEEMEKQDEVRVAWGTGIAGHVAESGEPVNIPDAYLVSIPFHSSITHFIHFSIENISHHSLVLIDVCPFTLVACAIWQ